MSFGATQTVNATDDVRKAVRSATGGARADYVFVTVGAKAAIDQSFGLLGPGGAVVLVGIPANGVVSQIDPGKLAAQNQRVLGSKMGTARIREDIPRLIGEYRAGRLKVAELITGRYPLDEINEAIASVVRGEALRNVIVFGE
jgi:Zn-dependent alcohol dehydrogenase